MTIKSIITSITKRSHPSYVFWAGCFNSYVTGQFPKNSDWMENKVFEFDQISMEWKPNGVFKDMNESSITFPPTFPSQKYTNMSSQSLYPLDPPTYTDRVFYMGKHIKTLLYTSLNEYIHLPNKPVVLITQLEMLNSPLNSPRLKLRISNVNQRQSSVFGNISRFFPKRKSLNQIQSNITPTSSFELREFSWDPSDAMTPNGNIFLSMHVPTKKEYMIQISTAKKNQIGKMEMLTLLESQWIIKYHQLIQENDVFYIIMDYKPHRSLECVVEHKRLNDQDARFYVTQILEAVMYLHSFEMVHGDICLANVSIYENGYCKLTGGSAIKSSQSILPPEHDNGSDFTPTKSYDLYQIGILTYTLLCGHAPYLTHSPKVDPSHITFPSHLGNCAKSLLQGLLKVNPKDRLGKGKGGISSEIMKHPWFDRFDWHGLQNQTLIAPVYPLLPTSRDLRSEQMFAPHEKFEGKDVQIVSRSKRTSMVLFIDDEKHQIIENEKLEEIGFKLGFKDSKFLEICREIYQSERHYIDQLEIFMDQFENSSNLILSKHNHDTIFRSLDLIFKINTVFLSGFAKRVVHGIVNENFGEFLVESAQSFRLYLGYIQNYSIAYELVEHEKKTNHKFSNFLVMKYTDLMKKGLNPDMISYMVLPIQRLPRYKTLFEALVACAPENMQSSLGMALTEIETTILFCDKKRDEYGDTKKVFRLQERFKLPHKHQIIIKEKSEEEIIKVIWNQRLPMIIPSCLVVLNDSILLEHSKGKVIFEMHKEVQIIGGSDQDSSRKYIGLMKEKESMMLMFESEVVWKDWSKLLRAHFTKTNCDENLSVISI